MSGYSGLSGLLEVILSASMARIETSPPPTIIPMKPFLVFSAIPVTLIALFYGVESSPAREWKDVSGRTVSADFVALEADGVRVKLSTGKETVLKKDVLADGEWAVAQDLANKTEKNAAGADHALPVLLARTVATERNESTNWQTYWGSYDKTIDNKRVVEVSVRSSSDTDRTVVVEALWLADDGHGNVRGVMGVIRKELVLTARATQKVRVPMVYSSRDLKLSALGLRFVTGSSFGGWIMRISDPVEKKVIVQQGSRPPLLSWSDKVPVVGN